MYKIIIKHDRDFVIEDLTHTLISAQEYFDVDLMPEAMAIAKKIGATNEIKDIIEEESK